MANERTTFAEAFKMADNVLYMGVRGVTDLMVNPGLVNLDFADIRTVMAEMGKAMMGTGEMEGEERAVKAAESAISNPLLEDTFMRGARGVLINITGGYDMTLFEVDEAVHRIRKEVDEDANIIFGSSIDENMNGRIRVSVVATGIDAAVAKEAERPKLVAVGGGVAQPLHAVSSAPVTAAQPARPGVVLGPRVAAVPAGGAARAAHAFVQPAQLSPAQPATVVEAVEAQAVAEPVILNQAAEPGLRAPATTRPAAPPQPAGGGGFRNLFRTPTGLSGLMRRDVAEPASPQPASPRVEPVTEPAPRATVRAVPQEEMGLDIPTFLRRQST
jgi:cell division protein FtsZ